MSSNKSKKDKEIDLYREKKRMKKKKERAIKAKEWVTIPTGLLLQLVAKIFSQTKKEKETTWEFKDGEKERKIQPDNSVKKDEKVKSWIRRRNGKLHFV